MKKQLLVCATVLGLGLASGTLAQPPLHPTAPTAPTAQPSAEIGWQLAKNAKKKKLSSRVKIVLVGAATGLVVGSLFGQTMRGFMLGTY